MTATTMPKPGELIEEFPITTQHAIFHGSLHRTERRSGRRVIVRECQGGPVLFDTDDCYDSANVRNKLEMWLSSL